MPQVSRKKKTKSPPQESLSLSTMPGDAILHIISQASNSLPAQDTLALLSTNQHFRAIGNSAHALRMLEDGYATDNEIRLEDEIQEIESQPERYANHFHQFYMNIENRFHHSLEPRALHFMKVNLKFTLAMGALMIAGAIHMCFPRFYENRETFFNRSISTAAEIAHGTTFLSLALLAISTVAIYTTLALLKLCKTADNYRNALIKKPTAFFISPKLHRRYNQQRRLDDFRDKADRVIEEHISLSRKK